MGRLTTRKLTVLARPIAVLLLLALSAGAAAARSDTHQNSGASKGPPTSGSKNGSIGRKAVVIAKRYLGVKYKWGGASPKTGFDCSGLTMYVYAQLGVQLTHYSGAQWHEGYRVARNQLRRGDLVFFDMSSAGPQHEGMYVGDGKFIQAPHTGDVVKISKLFTGNYAKNYVGAVRPYGLGPPFLFPVIGAARYTNDFGQSGNHGIDIAAPRKAVIAAPEPGRVQLWHSKTAGCALTLFGKSLNTYVLMHLNDDLSSKNDNLGRCNAGTAYAPNLKNGVAVKSGQVIAFVGDSGSAEGTSPHVNLELHPRRGDPVNPYRYLNRAKRLVFATLPGQLTLRLSGELVSVDASDPTDVWVQLHVDRLRAWPGGFIVSKVNRTMMVEVTDLTVLKQELSTGTVLATLGDLEQAGAGKPLSVSTAPTKRTLQAQLGEQPLPAATLVLKLRSSGS
jgi:murein DD-endopeptidase MepM/ murein hydrolase activator NlpD